MRPLRLAAFALAFLFAVLPARAATDYTDIWWASGGIESGWGVNFAQQQNSIFATFYIFGPTGTPVWYTALMTRSVGENFTGSVFASTGSWFGAPWVTPPPATAVGTATFTASSPYRGAFNFRIDTVQIAKQIERFGFLPVSVGGTYLGAMTGVYTGNCSFAPFNETRQFLVSQSGNPGTVTIDFIDTTPPHDLLCRMQGTGSQFGRMITVANAQYICTGFATIPVNVTSIAPLDGGVEIHWVANDAGCIETGRAAAVMQQ